MSGLTADGRGSKRGWPLRRFGRLILKELQETLRDRRTTITLVAMPLLLYPLLGILLQGFVLNQLLGKKEIVYVVGFESDADAARFATLFELAHRNLLAEAEADPDTSSAAGTGGGETVGVPQGVGGLAEAAGIEVGPKVEVLGRAPSDVEDPESYDLVADVQQGIVDVGVRLTPLESERVLPLRDLAPRQPYTVSFVTRRGSAASEAAAEFLRDHFERLNRSYLSAALIERPGGEDLTVPVAFETEAIGEEAERGFELAALVPLILVLMTITGAVYPAIDLTAGERERGTLESLIAAPIPRSLLLAAKYVSVLTVALLTALMNIAGMYLTAIATGLDALLSGPGGLTLVIVVQIFGLLVLFASFFSAVLLCISSSARSFKEAQAYLIPVMLVSLAPGIVTLLPGLKLSVVTALVPLANVVLLARDLLAGSAELYPATLAVVATAIYTLLVLALAARVFGTDAILYGGEGGWKEILSPPDKTRAVPSPTEAGIYLAMLFPAFLILTSTLSRLPGIGPSQRLIVGACVTILLFAMGPHLFARLRRLEFRPTFRFAPAGPAAFAGAALLGLSLWVFAFEFIILLLPEQTLDRLEGAYDSLVEGFTAVPLPLLIVALAVVPAVCEEFLFRGMLFSALDPNRRPARAIFLSALAFGLFHILTDRGLLVRFPGTFLLGLALGAVAWRCGSVLPGMLMHGLNNSALLVIAHYKDQFGRVGLAVEDQQHLPGWLIGLAGLVAVGGFALTALARRSPPEPGGPPANPEHAAT